MPKMRNIYRRYSLACTTLSMALFIGFHMERSEASQAPVQPADLALTPSQPIFQSRLDGGALSFPDTAIPAVLPNLPSDHRAAALPSAPVLLAVASDRPVGILPEEEATPALSCSIDLEATPTAGAMVDLHLTAPCQPGVAVTVHHGTLIFTDTVGDDGLLAVSVPAMSETAVFAVLFANGDGATATAQVDSLPFYDRTVIQWSGVQGVELHAREFGANYGDAGHVWRDQPRDVSAVTLGDEGFLVSLGSSVADKSRYAEVYTFPRLSSDTTGDVALSVEAEITAANCGRPVTVSATRIDQGKPDPLREMALQIPDCDAVGEFLVLKNLVEDLKIAAN